MANIELHPTHDCYNNSELPTTSFPGSVGDSKLVAGYEMVLNDGTATPGYCETWLKFDLSGIPAGSTIDHTEFGMQSFLTYGDSMYDTNFELDVGYMSDNSWSETTLNYINAPNASLVTNVAMLSPHTGTPGESFVLSGDLDSTVQTALATGALSLRIQLNGHYGLGYGVYFQGYEFYSPPGIVPFLLVDYTAPPVVPPVGGGPRIIAPKKKILKLEPDQNWDDDALTLMMLQ